MRKMTKSLTRRIILSLFALALAFAPGFADAAQVAVTVEKLTHDGGFIVEPEIVTFSGSRTAPDVLTDLLYSKNINFNASGSGSTFYL